ncbi:MAG: hypothetical protein ACYSR6_04420 [Planctomycetota bacterium]
MGTECVFCFWILIMLICVPVFIFGIRSRKWITVLVTGAPIALFVLIVLSWIYRSHMSSSPQWVYEQAFGTRPKDDTTVLEAQYEFQTDGVCIYLKFEISDINTIDKLDSQFARVSKQDVYGQLGSDSPDWFKPWENTSNIFLKASPYGDVFYSSEAVISYNQEDNIAYFYYIGIN